MDVFAEILREADLPDNVYQAYLASFNARVQAFRLSWTIPGGGIVFPRAELVSLYNEYQHRPYSVVVWDFLLPPFTEYEGNEIFFGDPLGIDPLGGTRLLLPVNSPFFREAPPGVEDLYPHSPIHRLATHAIVAQRFWGVVEEMLLFPSEKWSEEVVYRHMAKFLVGYCRGLEAPLEQLSVLRKFEMSSFAWLGATLSQLLVHNRGAEGINLKVPIAPLIELKHYLEAELVGPELDEFRKGFEEPPGVRVDADYFWKHRH